MKKLTDEQMTGEAFNYALHSTQGASGRWDQRKLDGLNDGELKEAIKYEFGNGGSCTDYGVEKHNGSIPIFTWSRDHELSGGHVVISGKKLIDTVRVWFKIPDPSKKQLKMF